MAIKSFQDKGTQDINYGFRSKAALKILPEKLHEKAQIKLARLNAMESLDDLRTLRGSRLEKLKGNRRGQCSIRINDQYRICFVWKNKNAENVEIVD